MYSKSMDTINHCLNLELRKANRVLSQLYDRYLNACGLKTSQFSVLRAVYLLKTTTNSELQDVLVLDQTTLSRALKPLMRDGLIESRPGADRRQKQLSLSSKGKDLYREAKPHWENAQAFVAQKLGKQSRMDLLDLSHRVIALKD